MPNPHPARRSVVSDAQLDQLGSRIIEMIAPCTNAQIARLIGVSDETIRRIRHGDQPSVRIIVGLCHAFDISADWLLLGRGEPPVIDHHAIIEPKSRNGRPRELPAVMQNRQ